MASFTITYTSSVKDYPDTTLDFEFEVLAAADCELKFILTT
jgi:hypothetical protein